jgi:hypothetical protein
LRRQRPMNKCILKEHRGGCVCTSLMGGTHS